MLLREPDLARECSEQGLRSTLLDRDQSKVVAGAHPKARELAWGNTAVGTDDDLYSLLTHISRKCTTTTDIALATKVGRLTQQAVSVHSTIYSRSDVVLDQSLRLVGHRSESEAQHLSLPNTAGRSGRRRGDARRSAGPRRRCRREFPAP